MSKTSMATWPTKDVANAAWAFHNAGIACGAWQSASGESYEDVMKHAREAERKLIITLDAWKDDEVEKAKVIERVRWAVEILALVKEAYPEAANLVREIAQRALKSLYCAKKDSPHE